MKTGQTVDLGPIELRIKGTEDTAKTLQDSVSTLRTDLDAAAGMIATSQSASRLTATDVLARRLNSGLPYSNELALLAGLGAPEAALATLKPAAGLGLKTGAALAAEFALLAPQISAAIQPKQPDTGFLQSLAESAGSLVEVKPAEGSLPSELGAIATDTDLALKAGRFTDAATRLAELPDAGRAVAAPFIDLLKQRAVIDAALADLIAAGQLK